MYQHDHGPGNIRLILPAHVAHDLAVLWDEVGRAKLALGGLRENPTRGSEEWHAREIDRDWKRQNDILESIGVGRLDKGDTDGKGR